MPRWIIMTAIHFIYCITWLSVHWVGPVQAGECHAPNTILPIARDFVSGFMGAEPVVFEDVKVVSLRDDERTELLVSWRADGSGGYLSYALLESSETGWHELLLVENIAKGTLEVTPAGLLQREAVFGATDPYAFPSMQRSTVWSWDGERFALSEVREEAILYPMGDLSIASSRLSAEIEQLIEQKARAAHVPPVLVKAIALVESGGRHWDSSGNVIRGSAGEIGIMQIMPNDRIFSAEEIARLYDLEYNIETGIKILLEKKMFSGLWRPVFVEPDLETLAMHDIILESWYFALWSYNGWVQINNPAHWGSGNTYQCKVLFRAESLLGSAIVQPDVSLFQAEKLPRAGELFVLPGNTVAELPPLPAGATGEVIIDELRVRAKPATVFGPDKTSVPVTSRLYLADEVSLLSGPSTATLARWYKIGTAEATTLGWSAAQYKPTDRLEFDDYMKLTTLLATLEGEVTDLKDEGMDGVVLKLLRDGVTLHEQITQQGGKFIFSGLSPENYTLSASSNRFATREIDIKLSAGVNSLSASVQMVLLGDVNLDGHVNAADIVLLNRHALGIETISHELALLAADVNGDGNINAADIVPLNRHALGIEPIGSE